MARFSAAFRTTGAGSTTLPIGGIRATTTGRPRLREVGCFNTTTTEVAMALRRFVTDDGTPGSAITAVYEDDDTVTALATVLDTWTVTPTFVTGNLRVATLAAAKGSGVIWTFGGNGLEIPATVNTGIVLVPLVGAGQICDVSFTWDQ
jgi:hypothetical protein